MQTPEQQAHRQMLIDEAHDRHEADIDRHAEDIWNTQDEIGKALVQMTSEGVCAHLLDDVVRQLAENRIQIKLADNIDKLIEREGWVR